MYTLITILSNVEIKRFDTVMRFTGKFELLCGAPSAAFAVGVYKVHIQVTRPRV